MVPATCQAIVNVQAGANKAVAGLNRAGRLIFRDRPVTPGRDAVMSAQPFGRIRVIHARDPLGSLKLVEEDFAWATLEIMDIADRHCDSKIVSVLEGGYDLQGLAGGVGAHLQTLMHGEAAVRMHQDNEDEGNG